MKTRTAAFIALVLVTAVTAGIILAQPSDPAPGASNESPPRVPNEATSTPTPTPTPTETETETPWSTEDDYVECPTTPVEQNPDCYVPPETFTPYTEGP